MIMKKMLNMMDKSLIEWNIIYRRQDSNKKYDLISEI